jgi:hypothetical protein
MAAEVCSENDECGMATKGVSERGNPEKASRD